MISHIGETPVSIPALDEILRGFCESAAVTKFSEAMQLPAMVLTAQDEYSPLRFLYVNGAFTTLCGYEQHEAIGETTALLQGEETDVKAARRFRREVERNGRGFTTLVNYRKDGTPYEIFLLGARLREKDDPAEQKPRLFSAFAFLIGDADYVVPRI